MRNLARYPLTKTEIVATLKRLSEKAAENAVPGSTDAFVLQIAAKIVEAATKLGLDSIPFVDLNK